MGRVVTGRLAVTLGVVDGRGHEEGLGGAGDALDLGPRDTSVSGS